MKRFDEILRDIKNVKVQGADNVAVAGITAYLLQQDSLSVKRIIQTRPTEPLLQNSLKILQKSKDKKKKAREILEYFKESQKKIALAGSKLIKNDMNIFVHCHSSTVSNILKKAKKQGKRFVVYNTEVQPLYQGRIMAKDLAKAKIKVIHLPDSAADFAIKKCDLFLFGADAYLETGVVNKIGTSMLSELAKLHKIPTYSCGLKLKFTKKVEIEFRSGREVWDEREKYIEELNPAFDFTKKANLSGVVCEEGILDYDNFIKKCKSNLLNLK